MSAIRSPHTGAVATKTALLDALRARLIDRFATIQQAAVDAAAGATHEQARPENKYDTRALEQSYLSAGQSARIAALRDLNGALHFYTLPAGELDVVGPGALVDVEIDDGSASRRQLLFIVPFDVFEVIDVPGSAGHDIAGHDIAGQGIAGQGIAGQGIAGQLSSVQVIGAAAPMAFKLRGRQQGDDVVMVAAGKTRTLSVISVR